MVQNLAYATHYNPTAESEIPVALPNAPFVQLSSNTLLQPPLTHRGDGPGLILLVPALEAGSRDAIEPEGWEKPMDPQPYYKWAEEGYATLQATLSSSGAEKGAWTVEEVLEKGLSELLALKECTSDKVGLIVYDEKSLATVLPLLPSYPAIHVLVAYSALPSPSTLPTLLHLSNSLAVPSTPSTKTYSYTPTSPHFALPHFPGAYDPTASSVAHARCLEFFKKPEHLAGPIFDLETLWDQHTFFEFEDRSVAKTMGTMVAEPYVNHIPTMTGGIGRKALSEFYRDHFIFSNPSDTTNTLVSRTIGIDRVVDEFVMTLTHNTYVDWLIPGIPPTGKFLSVPMSAVVCIRGDRLYHEHISWDQATVLRQLDLLPSHLPFPYPVPGHEGKTLEVRLPVGGTETSVKLLDKGAWESNQMFGDDYGVRSV